MTRDQDFERHLTDWLSEGPSMAPTEVVDRAIEDASARPRRQPTWVRFRAAIEEARWRAPYDRRWQRLAVLAATVALIAATILLATVPFAGGPGPAPSMDLTSVRDVGGSAAVIDEWATTKGLRRELRIDVGDQRIEGTAHQALVVEDASEAGLQRLAGVMRLENDWGAWEGAINGVRYPDGTQIEYGWLAGEEAYAGFSYFHSTRDHPAEAERVLEGAIWPGEPPAMPDPSLLQADPLG